METTETEVITTEKTLETDQPELTPNASEIDEDYRWLTERLDAITLALATQQTLFQSQLEAIQTANQNALSESKTLIQSLTEIVTNQNQMLTTLAASAALQSIPNNSQSISTEQTEETITENPESAASVAQTSEQQEKPEKPKRKRL